MASSKSKDLVCSSVERVQPLPSEVGEKPQELSEEAEKEWLEVITEKADRGKRKYTA